MREPRYLSVKQLMAIQNPNTKDLGQVVELVNAACNTNYMSFISQAGAFVGLSKEQFEAELDRFKNSINNFNHLGLDARHADTRRPPPNNPMSLAEAVAFAQNVGAAWLAQFDREK